MWEEGFANGELTAELYGDVQPAMAAWVSQGLKTYIYSSGSRQAQKNLFAFTKSGDLRGLLSGYFDTTSGVKASALSLHLNFTPSPTSIVEPLHHSCFPPVTPIHQACCLALNIARLEQLRLQRRIKLQIQPTPFLKRNRRNAGCLFTAYVSTSYHIVLTA